MENKNKKILVVDDSPTQRHVLKCDLEKKGYTIITAENAITGVHLIYLDPPDLIISDIIMPELSGYHFCRIIKNDPLLKVIPVILLTSLGQKQDKFWGKESGAESYIVKKPDHSELFGEVARLLQRTDHSHRIVQREISAQSKEFNDGALKSRTNHLLDRMLFESTVSNRIRRLILYSYNIEEIVLNFFKILNQILEYTSVSILISDNGRKVLYVDIREEVGKNHINDIKKMGVSTLVR